jgi:hypothetical protein
VESLGTIPRQMCDLALSPALGARLTEQTGNSKKISKKTDIEGLIKLKEFNDDPKGLRKKVQYVVCPLLECSALDTANRLTVISLTD